MKFLSESIRARGNTVGYFSKENEEINISCRIIEKDINNKDGAINGHTM